MCFVLVKSPLSLSGHGIGQPGSGFHTHSEPRRARCVLGVFGAMPVDIFKLGMSVYWHLCVQVGKLGGSPLPTEHMFSRFHVYKRGVGAVRVVSTMVRNDLIRIGETRVPVLDHPDVVFVHGCELVSSTEKMRSCLPSSSEFRNTVNAKALLLRSCLLRSSEFQKIPKS